MADVKMGGEYRVRDVQQLAQERKAESLMGKQRHPFIVVLFHLIYAALPHSPVPQLRKESVRFPADPFFPFFKVILCQTFVGVPLVAHILNGLFGENLLDVRSGETPCPLAGFVFDGIIVPGVPFIAPVQLGDGQLQHFAGRFRRLDGSGGSGCVNSVQPESGEPSAYCFCLSSSQRSQRIGGVGGIPVSHIEK